MQDLLGFRVAIIASDGFEESELTEPLRTLREAKADVTIVGPKSGHIQGYKHFDKGQSIAVDRLLSEVSTDDFDAVVLPGGTINADTLRMNEDLQEFLRDFQQEAKPMAAICHAPWELVSADLVRDRTLTGYYTIQDDVRNAGGNWVDQSVVVDDNWVTSRQPSDLPDFTKAMVDLFATQHTKPTQRPAARPDTSTEAPR